MARLSEMESMLIVPQAAEIPLKEPFINFLEEKNLGAYLCGRKFKPPADLFVTPLGVRIPVGSD